MQIQIIAVGDPISKQSKNGKSYNELEVTYKTDGKTQSKKLVDFSNKDTYAALLRAQKGEVYEIATEKDNNGYWQWKAATKVEGAGSQAAADGPSQNVRAGSYNASASRYETPEERASKQIAIQKQNAFGVAATFLANKPKSTEEDLFRLGQAIFAFYQGSVFDNLPKDTLEQEFDGESVMVQ